MDLLRDMGLFVAVARTKSFTRAAKDLGMPISSLSRRISDLEKKVGVTLLHRTTRRLELTEAGRTYYERAGAIVDAAASAHEELRATADGPRGHLRVSMPADFGNTFLSPLFAEYASRYPDVSFEFDLSPRFVDLVAEGFDVAIRIGAQPDSGLATRKLTSAAMGLYASRAYIERCGQPARPIELQRHACLRVVGVSAVKSTWTLHRGKERFAVDVTGRVSANNPRLLLRLAQLGLGIAVLDELFVVDELESGSIVRILSQWAMLPETVYVVTPSKLLPAKTKLFLACLVEHIDLLRARLAHARE